MNYYQLLEALDAYEGRIPMTTPVRLIVSGVAHAVEDVWFEPRQEGVGAICIGDDPR